MPPSRARHVGKPKHLLKSQANDVFRAITEEGLDPAEFDWTTVQLTDSPVPDPSGYYTADMIVYRSDPAFFSFGRDKFGRKVRYSPGGERPHDEATARDWPQTIRYFRVWLKNIKREAEPSLWESVAANKAVSAGALDVPRTRFTPEEQTEILARLGAMTRQIEALETLTRGQKQLVSGELENIGNALKRMERGEWVRFAVGGIVTVLLASGLQQSVAASLMRWAVSAFLSMVTGHPMPRLQLPP
jgi:hypothetical protein